VLTVCSRRQRFAVEHRRPAGAGDHQPTHDTARAPTGRQGGRGVDTVAHVSFMMTWEEIDGND